MKLRLVATGLVLGAAALCTSSVVSQDAANPLDENAMMEMWMKIATPGTQHHMLEFFVGDWDVTSKIMMDPAAPPMESTGSSSTRAVLGGRFIQSEFNGTVMGMPMEGLGLMGFDNYKQKFNMAWADSLGTAMSVGEGLLDQTGKVLTFYGTMDEWMTGQHDKAVKYVYRLTGDDSFTFEVHDLGIVPGDTKVMEFGYTRRRPAG